MHHRCPPAGSSSAASIHADEQVISTEINVEFSVTRDRSRDTIGRVGSNCSVEGPSNRPDRSPPTRRRSACPTIRPSSASLPSGSSVGLRRRSEEHTSELQSRGHLVCRLLLEK